MKKIKYFFEFLFIIFLFIIFKIFGYKISSKIGSIIGSTLGPVFRSKKKILSNIKKAIININEYDSNLIVKNLWSNYGRILSEYVFLKDFRNSKLNKYLTIEGQEILNQIRDSKKPVIFVSGHFNNFELMAMQIEKSGINLAAIYRPLNNIFLNKVMEKIRIKYICKNQIKKGIGGTREVLKLFKKNYSIALMIDQRVSEGIQSNFYDQPAFTTTIPAQMVKKFNCSVVPIYIQRINNINFKMTVNKPINFEKEASIEKITQDLNDWLESMVSFNPDQWIWTHDRWK
tara:strand:- start:1410 stop:2270 length:861 start_codon:yes stop_codon:yes gene_type:complete